MATESPNDLELALKKRARRRLVGALALVLFIVIVLPMMLQDRAALAPQEAIKIRMPDDDTHQQIQKVETNVVPIESQAEVAAMSKPVMSETVKSGSPADTEIDNPVQSESAKESSEIKKESADEKKVEDRKSVKKAELTTAEAKKAEVKSTKAKVSEIKKSEGKESEGKESEAKATPTNGESFTIQVGVFSDIANVKQLQARLKQVGLDSHTESITTQKGEKIRLRAGHFNSRQEAAYALTKLQAADLTGIIISNN